MARVDANFQENEADPCSSLFGPTSSWLNNWLSSLAPRAVLTIYDVSSAVKKQTPDKRGTGASKIRPIPCAAI